MANKILIFNQNYVEISSPHFPPLDTTLDNSSAFGRIPSFVKLVNSTSTSHFSLYLDFVFPES